MLDNNWQFHSIRRALYLLLVMRTEWPSQSVPVANGTAEGDVLVLNSVTLRVQTMVRKAHITVVTTMGFSEISRDLMSTSMDSSARVTVITETKNNGFNMWIILFFIMLAVAAYILKNSGKIREETRSRILSHFRH